MYRNQIDLDTFSKPESPSNFELGRLRVLNSKLRTQNLKLHTKNLQLERGKLEIADKMKTLRQIQMRTELCRKYSQELQDLETIVEDSELFLESHATGADKERDLFFSKSVASLTTNEDLEESSVSGTYNNLLFEPVLDKLAKLELPEAEHGQMRQLRQELSSSKSAMEFCILFTNGFEHIFEQLNVKIRFLMKKNEQMTSKLGKKDDQYDELLHRTRQKNEEFQEMLNSALDTNKRLRSRQKKQFKAVKKAVKKKYQARLNHVIDTLEEKLKDQRIRSKFKNQCKALRKGKSELRLTIEDFSQVASCRPGASALATSIEMTRKSDKMRSFQKKLRHICL